MSHADSGFVRLHNGLRLRYVCAGDGGPTALLLHGWPETNHAWRRVLPTLAASGYVVVAPDLRGCGDSDKPTAGYDAHTRMEDVRELAAAHPSEVAGLALLSAAPGLLPRPALDWVGEFHQTPDLPELLIGPHLDAYLRHFFRAWSHDPGMLSEHDLQIYVSALARPGALRASLASFRVPPMPAVVTDKVPTLLLVGESDPRLDFSTLPAETEHLKVQTIPRGGHWLAEERPDPVAAALLTFFREQTSGDSA